MQSSTGRFFKRNISSSWNNRSSRNYGKDKKKQNGANGVHDYKMSFAIQHHYKKERNETPRSGSSTIHSIIKFPTNQGIVTMETRGEALWECRHLERVQDVLQENIGYSLGPDRKEPLFCVLSWSIN
ncbi:hypothetical protein Tco_1302723 [Tanacetum coccineum]